MRFPSDQEVSAGAHIYTMVFAFLLQGVERLCTLLSFSVPRDHSSLSPDVLPAPSWYADAEARLTYSNLEPWLKACSCGKGKTIPNQQLLNSTDRHVKAWSKLTVSIHQQQETNRMNKYSFFIYEVYMCIFKLGKKDKNKPQDLQKILLLSLVKKKKVEGG